MNAEEAAIAGLARELLVQIDSVGGGAIASRPAISLRHFRSLSRLPGRAKPGCARSPAGVAKSRFFPRGAPGAERPPKSRARRYRRRARKNFSHRSSLALLHQHKQARFLIAPCGAPLRCRAPVLLQGKELGLRRLPCLKLLSPHIEDDASVIGASPDDDGLGPLHSAASSKRASSCKP